jgi:4-hydroxybenzoate polyprenyltransferase
VQACHPLPTVFVTTLATAYGLVAGLSAGRAALLAAAVLTGQLSIGWCNDWIDADLDTAAGRRDKPVPRGDVARRTVGIAAASALAASLVLSFALGLVPGLVHCLMLAGGWAYDLGVKGTVASGVPYLVAFGALPAVATTALPHAAGQGPAWPAPGVVAGAALLGLGAHFANTVGDTEADAATGVRGLPQRVGPAASLRWTAVLVGAAAAALLTASTRARPVAVVLLVAGALTAAAGAVGGARSPSGRAPFRLTLAAVGLVVTGFVLGA